MPRRKNQEDRFEAEQAAFYRDYRDIDDERDARELLLDEITNRRAHLDGPADDWSEG